MSRDDSSHIRQGRGAVRPYLYGPATLPGFLEQVFGAVEIERHDYAPDAAHVELQVGDSVLVVEAGPLPPGIAPWKGSVYVYVEDVDAVYERALSLGATSLAPLDDKPYGERQAGFIDAAGNTWWIATCRREPAG